MKVAALVFFGLLIYAHQVRELDRPLAMPLCAFRDGEWALIGYALFAALALVGILYALTLRRLESMDEAANAVGSGLLLAMVVVTPSSWAIHRASAWVLIGSIFAHYAILLMGRPWLLSMHLFYPVVLAAATGFHSSGLWQKGLICYLVVVATIHHHLVKRRARLWGAAAKTVAIKSGKGKAVIVNDAVVAGF